MPLPNFLIIGAAKSGTSSLHRYLMEHPQIFMSPVKEPNFFALEGQQVDFSRPAMVEKILPKLATDMDAYQTLSQDVRREQAIGEASSWYLHSTRAPARIRHHIPDAKLIAILRNPAQRADSAYRMNVRDGWETYATFDDALADQRATWGHIQLGSGVSEAGLLLPESGAVLRFIR